MALFIGRLSKTTRLRDLEGVFERYGRMSRCDLKYGAEMAYGFVDFEDRRDAEDALRYEHGRDLCGSAMIVEWARGPPRRGQPGGNQQSSDECYKCNRFGHWARNCPEDRRGGGGGYRGGRPGGGGGGGGGRRDRSRSRSRDRGRRRGSGSRRSRSPYERRRRLSRSRSRSPSSRSRSPYANGNGNAGASRSPSPT